MNHDYQPSRAGRLTHFVLFLALLGAFAIPRAWGQTVDPALLTDALGAPTLQASYSLLDSALRVAEDRNDEWSQAEILFYVGSVAYRNGDSEKYLTSLNRAVTFDNVLSDSSRLLRFRNSLGTAYQTNGRFDRAIDLYSKNLLRSRTIGDSASISQALNNLANVYERTGEFNLAISMGRETIAIDSAIRSPHLLRSASNLLHYYGKAGKYDRLIDFAPRVIEAARDADDTQSYGGAVSALGNAYIALDDYEMAETYVSEAISVARAASNKILLTSSYAALFDICSATESSPDCVAFLDSAIIYSHDETRYSMMYHKGRYLIAEGLQPKSQVSILTELAKAYRELGGASLGLLYYNLKLAYLSDREERKEAKLTADELVAHIEATGHEYYDAEIPLLLASAYKGHGDFETAATLLDSAYAVTERQYRARAEGSASLNLSEIRQRDTEIAKQKTAVATARAESRQRMWIATGITVAGLLSLLYGYQQVSARRRERRQRVQIEQANAELTRVNRLLDLASKDAYHRVRNDFQSLSGYLDLLGARARTEDGAAAVEAASAAVAAMGEINSVIEQQQVRHEDSPRQLLGAYLATAERVYRERGTPIAVSGHLPEEARLTPQEFRWLAMLLNECLTNAAKHGSFPTRPGEGREAIRVEIAPAADPAPGTHSEGTVFEITNPIPPGSPAGEMQAPPDRHGAVGQEVLAGICAELGWAYRTHLTDHEYVSTIHLPGERASDSSPVDV